MDEDYETRLSEIRKMMGELEDNGGFFFGSPDSSPHINNEEEEKIEDSDDDEDIQCVQNISWTKILREKEKTENLHLLINYFTHNNEERQKEFDYCLLKNILNPFIEKVHIFYNKEKTTLPKFLTIKDQSLKKVASKINDKIVLVETCADWITYSKLLKYAENKLKDKIVCISNLDIFLDHNEEWEELINFFDIDSKQVLCLSRYEFNKDKEPWKDKGFSSILFGHTQDTWIFKGGINVPDTEFELGTFGCDIAFNHRLKEAGYKPINKGTKYKTFHYDTHRGVTSKNNNILIKEEIKNKIRIEGSYPENKGQLILPDYDLIKNVSLDKLVRQLNMDEYDIYHLKCNLLSKQVNINYNK